MTERFSKRSRSNGYCGSLSKIADARRIACGPKRAPGLLDTAASNGIPQTTASAPFNDFVYIRRMNDNTPAWVGSVAALVRLRAVIAWSIVFEGMAVTWIRLDFYSGFIRFWHQIHKLALRDRYARDRFHTTSGARASAPPDGPLRASMHGCWLRLPKKNW